MFDCDHHERGGYGFVGIAIFLLILFAIFARGGCGFGAGQWGNDCGNRVGPADFWAANGLAQAVPGFQAQNFTQQAVNFGETVATINQGNWSLSKQISDTASAAEIGNLRDQLYEARAKLMQQETINVLSREQSRNQAEVMSEFCNIKNNMLQKPQVQAIAGLPHVTCTNASPHLGFGLGSGCGC